LIIGGLYIALGVCYIVGALAFGGHAWALILGVLWLVLGAVYLAATVLHYRRARQRAASHVPDPPR
jgi:drug/metabolite transporter (DMT)-like permease